MAASHHDATLNNAASSYTTSVDSTCDNTACTKRTFSEATAQVPVEHRPILAPSLRARVIGVRVGRVWQLERGRCAIVSRPAPLSMHPPWRWRSATSTAHEVALDGSQGAEARRGSVFRTGDHAMVGAMTDPAPPPLGGLDEVIAPAEVVPQDAWDLSGRDTVPDLAAVGAPGDAGSAQLFALLNSDGAAWQPPYDRVREALGVRKKIVLPELEEQKDQRIRTWMVLFRGLGLVYEADGRIHVTELGRQFREVLQATYSATDDFAKEVSRANRVRMARVVGPALARYQLRTPLTRAQYAPDTDIHPLWAIWRAVRSLGNKIHWDELDRQLTTCLRMSDLDSAIEAIRVAREASGYDPNDSAMLDELLGPRRPVVGGADERLDRNQHDRVIIWLQRAAFHDLFLERTDRADGYRYANEEFLPLLDEMIAAAPDSFVSTGEPEAYFEWLGAASPLAARMTTSPFAGSELLRTVITRARQFGSSRIIALAGAAGTGKTALAREAALVLADSDETRVEVVQFHAAFTYEEFVGGLAPVGTEGFAPTAGILIQFNDRAFLEPEKTYVLVIDEVSRADTANVLGELLTYVEYRDRTFRIPALDRTLALAPNLVILATLNPSDRSVINMDDALVRRLRQIAVPRSVDALRAILSGAGMDDGLANEVCHWFEQLPEDAPFGHGLFVGVANEMDLFQLWHEQLSFFLRRGGITIYPDPDAIESGFLWRRAEFGAPPPPSSPAASEELSSNTPAA